MRARSGFTDDLESLRLQVEVMAILVGDAVEAARTVLRTGDVEVAKRMVEADDAIDEMQVSLTEHCYELLVRQAPVAIDLRLIVSVIRALHELERIGDLALRVANAVGDQPLIARHPEVFEVLLDLADNVVARYQAVQQGWSSSSIEPLEQLQATDPLAEFADPLVNRLMALSGRDAVRVALAAMAVGRSLDRIGDHTQIMASRLRYLVTGDPIHLADEVAW
jgi:phosphate transport system protein